MPETTPSLDAAPPRSLPTFIVAGSPRSGTTYLYHLLDHHSGIYMAKPRAPEPKFFLVDEEYAKGLDYYSQRFFAAGSSIAVRGEKSANYLESSVVPQRMQRDLPGVKLIFVLRDPVERAYSNYLWSKRNGHETLSFEDALEQESIRENHYEPRVRFARPFSLKSRGFYAQLLQPYLDRFTREQIKIVLHDDIVARPRQLAAELMTFVGVPAISPPVDFAEHVNTAREDRQTIPLQAKRQLQELFAEPNRQLETIIQRDLSHWGR